MVLPMVPPGRKANEEGSPYSGQDSGVVYAVKLDSADAITNSKDGVTDHFGKCLLVLQEMASVQNMPLLVHGRLQIPTRIYFIGKCYSMSQFHCDSEHLVLDWNSLFQGGLQPLHKTTIFNAQKGKALISAVTCGSKEYFLGTDSALHERWKKEFLVDVLESFMLLLLYHFMPKYLKFAFIIEEKWL
uniref:Uncharacterized protein n=1 Tax=Chenopodium quinoa TaxID=63459 RepID=A0A803MX46_CHEQI